MKKKEKKKNEGKEEEIGVKREACERERETFFMKQILFFFLQSCYSGLLVCYLTIAGLPN